MIDEFAIRRSPRVRDDIPVVWQIDGGDLHGQGVFRNVSVSGALMETKVVIPLATQKAFQLVLKAENLSEAALVPSIAKIVWSRPGPSVNGYFFYGLEFRLETTENLAALEQRISDRLEGVSSGLNMGMSNRHFGLSE